MAFELPPLPYDANALQPYISAETIEYHYGKHHQAYVNKLNGLIEGTQWANKSLEEMIKEADGAIFNNAAQVWNHTFYWHCLSPNGGGQPMDALADAMNKQFGSFDNFKKAMTEKATGHFGSGWAWLVRNTDGELAITTTDNANNPMRNGQQPLLTCDVWEHAYYIDTRNNRAKYVDQFWHLVNWAFVAAQFAHQA